MKTYAELKRGSQFNWNRALDEAIKQEPSPVKTRNLRLFAGRWVTCVCGNQCAALPRESNGCPKDRKLRDLGVEFSISISLSDWLGAKETLALIEARSTLLLQELNL